MSKKDVACQLLIRDLKESLPNEVAAWEQALVSLTQRIDQCYENKTFNELSLDINEALFLRLFSSKELSIPQKGWLCEHSLRLAPNDSILIPDIINLSSWS